MKINRYSTLINLEITQSDSLQITSTLINDLQNENIFRMVIITKGTIYSFAKKHPNALIPLNEWYEKTKLAQWKKFTDVRLTFTSVDSIGNDRYVFDIECICKYDSIIVCIL